MAEFLLVLFMFLLFLRALELVFKACSAVKDWWVRPSLSVEEIRELMAADISKNWREKK